MELPNILENFPMGAAVSLRAGGCARYFAKAASVPEILAAREFARARSLPVFVLGKGTNLLVSDKGYEGLVIKLGGEFLEVEEEPEGEFLNLKVGAAVSLSGLARQVSARGFAGLHLLAGIPGTVGGAAFMNAGAYGAELADVVVSVEVLNAIGELAELSKSECEFGYRSSHFQKFGETILRVNLRLPKGDAKFLEAEIDRCMRARRERQPLDKPNAGSSFKRPREGFPGALIEQAGLKGFRVGDAQVSEKHANFIVNLGHASASDIAKVFETVEREVLQKTGVQLEREVIFLGEF